MSEKLDNYDPQRKGTHSFGSRFWESYTFENENWWKSFRQKDQAYVHPPQYLVIYGLPTNATLVVLRYPHGLNWKKVLPQLHKVALEYDRRLMPGKRERAHIEGSEKKIWASKLFTSYDWVKDKFIKVKEGKE